MCFQTIVGCSWATDGPGAGAGEAALQCFQPGELDELEDPEEAEHADDL